jgi:hypothetical protein
LRALSSRVASTVSYVVRAQRRLPIFGRAHLQRDGRPDRVLDLRNISRSGFMAEIGGERIPAGSRVRLVIPFVGPMTADVRWSHDGRMGCQLTDDLSRRQLTLLFLFSAPRSLPAELKMAIVTLAALAAYTQY